MKVSYLNDVRQSPDLNKLMEKATAVLGEVIGESSDQVTAEWGRAPDGAGHVFLSLKLSDNTGSVADRFAPEEFAAPTHLRRRLLDLWGDLLQVRSHKLLDDLRRN